MRLERYRKQNISPFLDKMLTNITVSVRIYKSHRRKKSEITSKLIDHFFCAKIFFSKKSNNKLEYCIRLYAGFSHIHKYYTFWF